MAITNKERSKVATELPDYVHVISGESNPFYYLIKAMYGDTKLHEHTKFVRVKLPDPENTYN